MKTTHLIIALNVVIYAAMLAIVGTGQLHEFSNQTLLQFGALYPPLVRDGEVWRTMTAVFIHITPWHIGMNMVALYQVGVELEPHYGRGRYTALYLLAGLGGSAGSLLWNWSHPVVAAGASGAICGLIGAGAVTGQLIGGTQGKRFSKVMIEWAVIVIVFGFFVGADNAAHVGGFVTGAAIAWLFDHGAGWMKRRRQASGLGLDAIALIAVVGVSFGFAARYQKSAVSVEDLINQGVELSRAGKIDQAIGLYRRAAKMDPHDEIAHFDLGLSLLKKNQLPEAEKELRAALKIAPSKTDWWPILAQILHAEGKETEAVQAMQKYFELGGKAPGK
jgi:rhomboid protease GluP